MDIATLAAFVKESGTKIANATKFNRKSGIASGEICGFHSAI
jgi:hypothetical protein